MKNCYIACALDCEIKILPQENDLTVGADKGYFTFVKNGILPDVAIGDFDSYDGEIKSEKIITFPVKKDYTDCALAIDYAITNGYENIVVFGGIGGLLDHTIANISLAASYAEKGINVSFVDGENVLFAIHNSSINFDNSASGRISVFSYGDKAEGVTEKGLLYTLNDYEMSNRIALGVSNEFVEQNAEISVMDGTLLIYTSKENFENHLTR